MRKGLDALLHYDGLMEAERASGKSYKEDPDTMWDGFARHAVMSGIKQQVLTATGDTYFNIPFADAMAIFGNVLGFSRIWSEEFDSGWDSTETNAVLWNPWDGCLLHVTSFTRGDGGQTLNSADAFYNWRPNEGVDIWPLTSSGTMTNKVADRVWIGSHDAREGFRYKYTRLKDNGTLLHRWVDQPFLWFANYTESNQEGFDSKARNAEVISQFPQSVRQAIGL